MRDGFNFLRWEEKEFKIGTKYSNTYLDIELEILEDSWIHLTIVIIILSSIQ